MSIPVIGALLKIGGAFVEDFIEGRKNRREIRRAVAENKVRLAKDQQSHNHSWEMAALEGRDKFLRRGSFLLLTAPLIWAGVDPVAAQGYFSEALGALPDWYVYTYSGMLAAIWGVSELKAQIK